MIYKTPKAAKDFFNLFKKVDNNTKQRRNITITYDYVNYNNA